MEGTRDRRDGRADRDLRAKRSPAARSVGPELAQAVITGMPNAIVVVNEAGQITEFNPAAEAIFGHSRDEALGEDMVRLLLPGRRRRVYRDALERFWRTGDGDKLRGFHLRSARRAVRADGTEFAVESTVLPVTVGGTRFCCAIIRDASDLEENEKRLIRLVAALPAAVLVEDEERRIVLVNDYFCDLFQISAPPAELTGADAVPVIAASKHVAADPDGFLLRAGQIAAARELVPDEEVVFADGRIFDRDYVPVMVGQEWHGQLWLYWDVTERRAYDRQRERILAAELKARRATDAARRKLHERNHRLRELDEFKTQFMSTLSHELRTPLTSIVSFIGLLRDAEPPLGPQAAEFVEIIERNSDRLLRLVSDLLLLGSLEAGSLPLDLANFPAAGLAEEAVRTRSAPAYRRGVTIELEAEDGPPLRVDRLRMLQVLDNLISNAIKFTEPGGHVHVAARCDADEWQIDVADSGIGIPAEEQDKIFERFFRASNARIEAVPGTGLGLSVVQAIVELHGGRLEMQSTPGKGTTFSVFLKAAR